MSTFGVRPIWSRTLYPIAKLGLSCGCPQMCSAASAMIPPRTGALNIKKHVLRVARIIASTKAGRSGEPYMACAHNE